jgi:hypothetical protein
MRTKEVEEAIKNINEDKKMWLVDFHYREITSCKVKDIETVLSYISKLEEENLDWKGKYHLLSRKIDVTPNSVIRDKIKELEDKLKYICGCDNNCKKCFNSERENSFEYCFAYHQIKILKSIIEGEK